MHKTDGRNEMQNKKQASNKCPCCGCEPCDCHGVNNELWGMGQKTSNQPRQNSGLVGKRDWNQSISCQPLENRKHTKNRILLKDLHSDFQVIPQASFAGNPRRCFLYWDSV